MSVFQDFKEVDDEIKDGGFIRWIHNGVPDEPEIVRNLIRNLLALTGHCLECTALSGCLFIKYSK